MHHSLEPRSRVTRLTGSLKVAIETTDAERVDFLALLLESTIEREVCESVSFNIVLATNMFIANFGKLSLQ